MEIREIMEIQRKCRKQAKEMTKQAYSKYDAIWADGIQITPELLAMGKNLVRRINAKMPNMLMHNEERPDIVQLAVKYGFENAQDLVDYLLAYKPRKTFEEWQYQSLLINSLIGCSMEEIEVAAQMPTGAIMSIIRRCRAIAKEMMEQAYEKYDEIWAGKIRITPELLKHGKEVILELNRKMPNMLTHNPMCSALDQVAMEYRFDSSQELVDWLLDYKPRTSYLKDICDTLVRQELCLPEEEYEMPMDDFASYGEIDEVPF